MFKKILLNYQKLQDLFFTKQLYYFSEWLKSEVVPERRVFLVETSWISKKVSLESTYRNSSPSFLFCEKHLCSQFFKNNLSKEGGDIPWKKIFDHGEYEIFENLESFTDETKPLRLGLSYKEQEKTIHVAKKTLTAIVTNSTEYIDFENLFSRTRLNELCDIDVVLWVDGKLRGSQIVTKKPFKDAVIDAVKKSYNDSRFSKITEDELNRVRIEVVFFQSLLMPLTNKEIQRDIIYYTKRYQSEVDNKKIQYIPTVFNCREFLSLFSFLEELFLEKSQSILSTKKLKTVFISEVSSYIESEDHKSVIECNGPIPQVVTTAMFQEKMDEYVQANILYLKNNQDMYGNIPAVVNPINNFSKSEDVVRLCFVTYSLFYYDCVGNDTDAREVAEKSFLYLKNRLYEQTHLPAGELMLSYIYFARAAKLCKEMEASRKSVDHIEVLFSSAEYNSILYSQYARFLLEEGMKEKAFSLIEKIFQDFVTKEKSKKEISLAEYAELPELLLHIEGGNRDYYTRESKRIVSWYLTQQNSDGSFYSSSINTVPYIRGTGKVLEVLAGLDDVEIGSIDKAMVWCMNMQYTKESSYFIPKETQGRSLGGLRHDYGGYDIWIDAIGHMLMAYSYYSSKKHTHI